MQNADHHQDSIATDLTRFQLEILYLLGQSSKQREYGLGLKRKLEAYYDDDVNNSRLYPNLNQLVDAGLLNKGVIDKRTNYYGLSDDGAVAIRRDAQRRFDIADSLPANAGQTDGRTEPEVAAGTGGDD